MLHKALRVRASPVKAGKRRKEPYAYEHSTPPQAVDCCAEGIVGLITGQHIKGSA